MGMICRKCRSKVETVAKYCGACGEKLELMCDRCGELINPDAKFCPGCGDKLFLACPECGAQVSLSAKFCQSCGCLLPKAGADEPDTPVPDGYAEFAAAAAAVSATPMKDGGTVPSCADEPPVRDEERDQRKELCGDGEEDMREDACRGRLYKPFAKAERVVIRGPYISGRREGKKRNYMPLLVVLVLGLAVFFSGKVLHEFKIMLFGDAAPVAQTDAPAPAKQTEEPSGGAYTPPAEEDKEPEPEKNVKPVLAVPAVPAGTGVAADEQEDTAGAVINGTKVNMRKGPGLDNAVIYNFPGGEKIKILGEKKSQKDQYAWYNVSYKGKTGWVYGKYVKK